MDDRRMSQRLPLELPVEVQWKSPPGSLRKATGKTDNISGSGLFIEIPTRLRRATSITIKVMLRPEATRAPVELLCKARVVRWNRHGEVQGVGAIIDEYELRPVPRTKSGGKRR
jgi:hypothetical protein